MVSKKKDSIFFHKERTKYPLGKTSKFLVNKVEPFAEFILILIAILIIFIGVIDNVVYYFKNNDNMDFEDVSLTIRKRFGEYLILSLTVVLSASIIKLTRISSIYQILHVVMLILIRQLIVYFLSLNKKG